ncbi:MAG: PAS domain S-box protein [Bacteroidetes bacterium]|nr:PAS domain S-box protein [Bacteroidota bacterium]
MTDQPQFNGDLQKELTALWKEYDALKASCENELAIRREVEEKLLFINTAIESSSEAIGISDALGRHFYQNKAFSDLFGYASAEELQAAGGGPGGIYDPGVAKEMFSNIMNGKPWSGELEMVTKSGRVFKAYERADAIKDGKGKIVGLIGIIKDITERKKIEETLTISETRYRRLFETAKDGIVILDAATGMIMDVNPFLTDILGYSKDQFIEKAIWELGFFKDIVANRDNFLELQQNEYIRYDNLPLETFDGRKINVEFISNVYQVNSHKVIQCNIRVITERIEAETRINLSGKILGLLNSDKSFSEILHEVINQVRNDYRFDAVGIRIQSGDDYPYYCQTGFDEDFLKTENTLIERTLLGGVCKDKNGKPCLECTCGLVIRGKTDSANPLFTEHGSFWTNDSPALLGLAADQEPRHNPRNRCIHEGYKSFALIPIRHNQEIIGLLQINDREKDCFTPILVKYFETIGETIGVALMRKQAEDALKLNHQLLFNLTEQVPGVVYQYRLFPDGRSCFPYSSSGMYEIFEVTSDEVREDASLVFARIHPDDLQRFQELITESARTLQHFLCEFRVVLPGKGLRWQYSDAVPHRMDDGSTLWHGIIYDNTDRKHSEKALTESENLYRNLVETSLDGVYKSTHTGRFVEVNPALVKMLGYESKEALMAIDIKTQLYFEPADRESLIEQELLEETGVYRLRKKDGSELWVEDHAWYDFDENGEILYHEGIIRDITDRKLAEDKIHLLNETLEVRIAERTKQLETINKQLEFQMSELEQFAYVSNHDLQEPLRTLVQFTELIRENYSGKLDEDGNKYIDFISRSAARMNLLVKDLFDYSLLGKESIYTLVDCNKIVNEVLIDLDDAIKGSNSKVVVQELPSIHSYETELRLLFQNLISNAIKYQKPGNVPEITIAAESRDKEWLFKISDNGIGIDEKHKDKIFIIFQRLHNRDEYQGTGIGLAHCKKVVELHGGKIWVESTPGIGSVFMFTIPKN